MILKDFRTTAKGLPDLLPYGFYIDSGIILNKDGSFLAAWEYKGKDTASSTPQELDFVSKQFSNAAKSLGSGWLFHVHAMRTEKIAYPDKKDCCFPDPISELLDDTRRNSFGKAVCFGTSTFITITYRPDTTAAKLAGVAKEGVENKKALEKALETFKNTLKEFEDALSSILDLERLREEEFYDLADKPFLQSHLLTFIEYCVSGFFHAVRVPPSGSYLDSVLAESDFVGGIVPRLENGPDKYHLAILSIDGLPAESYPAMLALLDSVPFEFRLATRFIALDQFEAEKELTMYVKGWNQQVLSFKDQFFNTANAKVNRDALEMREDAEIAKMEVQGGYVGAGYMTNAIVIMDTDLERLHDNARELRKLIQNQGFGVRIEDTNAVEAWLSTLPGVGYANVRRSFVHTLTLADMLPLQSIWTGSPIAPCPFYTDNKPPLAVFVTENESTPFWFNIHDTDLGHTLIFGPTGSGKSTLLAELAWNFQRYKDARLFVFDKGMSMYPLCKALGGAHYDVGKSLSFAPLQRIDEENELQWCEEWLQSLVVLQGLKMTPGYQAAIHDACIALHVIPEDSRSLTAFNAGVMDLQLQQAFLHYTISGAMGRLLDAKVDTLDLSRFMVFEIEELMSMGEKNLVPTLMYIFHRIQKALDGKPTWIVLDEAWVMLGNEVFRGKIVEWLKVLRKANCAVILATQSLSDAKKSGILDVLVESCPTKIYLANTFARQDDQYELYRSIGLNDRQINILADSTPKRDYYMVAPKGRRQFQMRLTKTELAFVGSSDKESIARIKELEELHGKDWPYVWLEEKNAMPKI